MADQMVGDVAEVIGGEDRVGQLLQRLACNFLMASMRSSSRMGFVMRTGVVMSLSFWRTEARLGRLVEKMG
jgi:hypothetical protein